mgnify:FL=1
MNKLQKAEENTMKIIKEVCDKNNIDYYMLGGTFLGAIRHKGFIPWDDDIDIGMKRDDFDKFISILKNENIKNIKVITNKDSESNYNYLCKVMNTDVKIYDDGCKTEKEYYAWIDIFPLDGLPNNILIRQIHKFRLLFNRCLWKMSDPGSIALYNSHRTKLEKMLVFIAFHTHINKILNKKKQLDKLDKILRKYKFNDCKYNINFMGAYRFKEVFKRDLYKTIEYYDFESLKLKGPKDYDYYLTKLYGNYNILPEEKDRNPHSTTIIE